MIRMAESTNTYEAGKGSITLDTMNFLTGADGEKHYISIDPNALGRASLYTSIKVIGIGDPPASGGDYSQGLPTSQTFTDTSAKNLDTTVLVDTGSYETVLPYSLIQDVLPAADLTKYPATTFSYSSSNKGAPGVWVPMKLALTTADNLTVVTTIPVIVPTDGSKFWMMGVGFNIGRGVPGTLPDTSTYGNAFLNIAPMADGSMIRGYVIDGTGIHLGLDSADVGGNWALQKLQPSARATPAGAPPDWQAATIGGTLDYPATKPGGTGTLAAIPPGNLLMDTGVSKSFVKTADALDEPPDGTKVSFNLFGTDGQVRYNYTLGSGDAQGPTADAGKRALVTGESKPGVGTFVNTGQHFLSGFDYLYDADNGYLGVRQNAPAASGNVQFTPLISASGPYAMPDGFAGNVPLYMTGDTQITVSGTAILSGGVEGRGTLTLARGTLVLSGLSSTADIALGTGTTLAAPQDLILSSLQANGAATLDVAAGAVLRTASGFTATPGGLGYGFLTVTGGGTLETGRLSVASGDSVLTGTIAGLDGATISGFAPGDLIEVNGLDARATAVTAQYTSADHVLTIAAGSQTAEVHITDAPTANMRFTVRTDGSGGTLVQMAPPAGSGASDALGATALRAAGGADGSGVIVGVISVGGNTQGGMAQDIANGDLPVDTQVLSEPSGITSDEGREMAQMIHCVAPGAGIRIAYAGGLDNGADIAKAIDQLVANHAKVIVDDMSVLSDRMYQEGGPVADAIARATAQGVVLVTSAGDTGTNYYEHALTLEQAALPGISGTVQAFNFGQETQPFLERLNFTANQIGDVQLSLGWTQPGENPAYQLRMAVFTENADGTYAKTTGPTLRRRTWLTPKRRATAPRLPSQSRAARAAAPTTLPFTARSRCRFQTRPSSWSSTMRAIRRSFPT